MTDAQQILLKLVNADQRYKLDAYLFVRDGLSYAHDVLNIRAEGEMEEEESLLE